MTKLEARIEQSIEAARDAGLKYITDRQPGIARKRSGKAFVYLAPDGKRVRDPATLKRIRSLAIPPAYEDVWIASQANAHLQATGHDARHRKQYRYHPKWRETRDSDKFGHVLEFGKALPKIRRRTRRDLKLPGLPRPKVLATVVQLLEKTLIRVGNEEYERQNKSFGLATMKTRHVRVSRTSVKFDFKGKSGIHHEINLLDPRLAKVVARCQALPGQDLFQYLDTGGEPRTISSTDVNDYLREITREEFTAKDFRTWAGTVLAAMALSQVGRESRTDRATKANVLRALESVAQRLGNTATICRKCYVHPEILQAYLDGETVQVAAAAGSALLKGPDGRCRSGGLEAYERQVLRLLRRRLGKRRAG